jgi:hypothetical protein
MRESIGEGGRYREKRNREKKENQREREKERAKGKDCTCLFMKEIVCLCQMYARKREGWCEYLFQKCVCVR